MLRNLSTLGLSEIEKSVVKSTYEDELAPKEKHVVFLTECAAEYDLVQLFDKRLTMPKWNVVFKTLIVLHRLSIEANDRFMKDLAQNHHTFNLHAFFDSTLGAHVHQEFIAKYADYLAQKVYVYKLLGVSVERRPPSESKEWGKKLSGFDLVKALPALSQQFDKLLLCQPYQTDIMTSQIPVAAMSLLVKDAFRIYSLLTVLMLGVVDHYMELDAAQTKLILQVCLNFRQQNAKFKKWTISLGEMGFAHEKLFPELVPLPDALFELLNDQIKAKGGKPVVGATKASVPQARGSASSTSATSAYEAVAKQAAPKKPAPKKPPVVDSDSDGDGANAMASDSEDEDVKPVTKKTASLTLAQKKAALAKKKAAQEAAAKAVAEAEGEEGEEEGEEEEEEEEDEEERARREAKKAKKAEKKAKKEAKKAKKAKKHEEEEEEEEAEEEEVEVVKPKAKAKKPAATASSAASGGGDLMELMNSATVAPVPVVAPQPLLQPTAARQPPTAAYNMPANNMYGYPAGAPAGGMPQQYGGAGYPQAYGGGAVPYGGGAPISYGAPYEQPQPQTGMSSALAQLQPLSNNRNSNTRASGSYNPGGADDNTTAIGGIHDPAAASSSSAARSSGVDPFGDLGPKELGKGGAGAGSKGKR